MMTTSTQHETQLSVYFDRLIAAFHQGATGRHAHLGHWDIDDVAVHSSQHQSTDADAFAAAQQRLVDRLIAMANLQDGQKILDVGCGFGGLLETIDRQVTDCELSGVNVDWRQLEICQRLQTGSTNAFRWYESDACDLPLPNGSLDVVFCVEAMFHFSSRHQFLNETRRVLKPGGRFVASDFTILHSPSVPNFAVSALLNDGYGPWPDPLCRAGSAHQLLDAGGWHDVLCRDATAHTLPSYSCIFPPNSHPEADPGDSAARSAMMLHWLHDSGHLRYEYLAATK